MTFFIRESWMADAASIAGGSWSVWQQLGIQVFAVIIAIGYAVVGTLLLVFLIDKIFGLKSTPEEEMQGLDHSYHGERGYGMLNPN